MLEIQRLRTTLKQHVRRQFRSGRGRLTPIVSREHYRLILPRLCSNVSRRSKMLVKECQLRTLRLNPCYEAIASGRNDCRMNNKNFGMNTRDLRGKRRLSKMLVKERLRMTLKRNHCKQRDARGRNWIVERSGRRVRGRIFRVRAYDFGRSKVLGVQYLLNGRRWNDGTQEPSRRCQLTYFWSRFNLRLNGKRLRSNGLRCGEMLGKKFERTDMRRYAYHKNHSRYSDMTLIGRFFDFRMR